MAWQNVRQHKGKRLATTAALSAIGAEHPLASDRLAAGLGRVIAAKNTVPVQGFDLAAAGAALLFKRKSSDFNAELSRTK